MKVLQISITEAAGMPYRIGHALNMAGIPCKTIVYKQFFFSHEHLGLSESESLDMIDDADFIHLHCLGTWGVFHNRIGDKPYLVHIHGHPDRGSGFNPDFPHVVATPDLSAEFLNSTFIPNVILPGELPKSSPLGDGPLRVFKSPSMHDKNHNVFDGFMEAIIDRLDNRVEYVAPKVFMTHRELVAMRATCHISLDHLHGYYGLESLESLCQGLVVVNGTDYQGMQALESAVGGRPPFEVPAETNEVGELLLRLIQEALTDPAAFERRRAKGPEFIRRHYQTDLLAGRWHSLYRCVTQQYYKNA